MKLQGTGYTLSIDHCDGGATVTGGHFRDICVTAGPLFTMRLCDENGKAYRLSSDVGWKHIEVTERSLIFSSHEEASGVTVRVEITQDDEGIAFGISVENTSECLSVMEISYPTPHMHAASYALFMPIQAGRLWEGAEARHTTEEWRYPQHASMQFFAAYAEEGGIYIGIEDGTASAKRFTAITQGEDFYIGAYYDAPGGTLPGNSFTVAGVARWCALTGDWFDAAVRYRKFVLREASWLPEAGMGRPDIAETFRRVPFWISDYIPNTPAQGDNRPMQLSVGSDIYAAEYWYRAPIELQKRLGVPLAYHVYNWHEIPFNIEYPHFLPAREEFLLHAALLRSADISVVPYINACAWEMHDDEPGIYDETFTSHGVHGVARHEDGSCVVERYPQSTRCGHGSKLAIMCGAWTPWHDRIAALVGQMQETLPIDGVYFDEIANEPSYPCYSRTHGHLPGGGSYWAEGYNRMMRFIRAAKPKSHFHMTECNAEPYMKYMDGFLTWMWVASDEVPAFPAVYHGFIQLIGRCTIGKKKEDVDFFKYANARSFVSGQILGWCKADVIYSEQHMTYLERLVRCRYTHADFFAGSTMLRPPKTETDLGTYTTTPGLWFEEHIRSAWVVGGSFLSEGGDEVRVFLVNFAAEDAHTTAQLACSEWGIDTSHLPDGCTLCEDGDVLYHGILEAENVLVLSFRTRSY